MATAGAKRYARAVFEMAQEEGRIDEWSRRLALVRSLLEDREIAAVLGNPTIATEDRIGLIDGARGLDQEAKNLAKLVVESRLIEEVGVMEEQFQELADEAAGRVRATATTAVELSEQERERVARELSRRLNKDVRLSVVVDSRILGGLKIQFGDHLIDASVAARLQQLRRRLATN